MSFTIPSTNEARLPLADGAELLDRFAHEKETPEELLRLRLAVQAWLGANRRVSLEDCLAWGVAVTPAKHANNLRNESLLKAASTIPAIKSKSALAKHLAEQWDRFICRGPWRLWRDDAAPPDDESDPFLVAIFWATRHNQGNCLSAKQIQRILDKNSA